MARDRRLLAEDLERNELVRPLVVVDRVLVKIDHAWMKRRAPSLREVFA